VPFSVIVSHVDELAAGPPEEVVLENAHRKASAVAARLNQGGPSAHDGPDPRHAPVLGVDTLVALGAGIYGKPADAAEARETLQQLSGRTHRVLSGLCLIEGDRVRTAAAVTSVSFRRLDEDTLSWYLRTGEWEGRAGGYAIQAAGAALVARIEGDYLNVVGLPVQTLLDLLPKLLQ
jgi:septum formation protein